MNKRRSGASRTGGPARIAALAAWALLLLAVGLFDLHLPAVAEPQGLSGVAETLAVLAATELLRLLLFVPLGWLAVLAVPGEGRPRRLLGTALGMLLGPSVLAAGLLASGQGFGWVDLALTAAACLVGAWIGACWLRGQRSWLLGKVLLLGVGLCFACAGAAYLLLSHALEERSSTATRTALSEDDKRHLIELFKGKAPQSLEAGATHSVVLEERDLSALAAWSLSASKSAPVIEVDLAAGRASLTASARLPRPVLGRSFLNLDVGGAFAAKDGRLELELDRLKLGGLEAPAALLPRLSRFAIDYARLDERVAVMLPAIREVALGETSATITYGHVELPQGFASQLFVGHAERQALVPAVRAHVRNLLDLAPGLPPGDEHFAASIQAAFALARDRSGALDPIAENEAALLALGMLVGRPEVETFVGKVFDEAVSGREKQDATGGSSHPLFSSSSIRGHHDWAQHWAVAAAFTVLSSKGIDSGIMPEHLDATGIDAFGFPDLMGDHAGARFAEAAVRDAAAARRMQERLAAGFRVDDFYPPAADLWSGSGEQFRQIYGTYDSPAFRLEVAEIERRLDACAGLR